jgi:predicted lipase
MASIMAYMGYSKTLDRLIIVFRGTVDVKNWL